MADPIKASIEVEIDPTPALLTWNVGQDDPHDHFPWTWTPDVDQKAGDPVLGHITTPNGRRPDGSMHTFWGITYGVWEPQGRLICALVNRWAHETFGTALPDPVAAPSPPWSLGWVDADGNPVLDDLSRDDVEGLAQAIHQTSTSAGDKLVRALRKQLEADDER